MYIASNYSGMNNKNKSKSNNIGGITKYLKLTKGKSSLTVNISPYNKWKTIISNVLIKT